MKLEEATPAQREAITTDDELVLCIAGPGSGKTATLLARIERLIAEGTPPAEIAVLTFTNAAAGEIQRRLPEDTAIGFVGTLHSFAMRMLKEHGASLGYGERLAIISPESAEDLLQTAAYSLACKTPIKKLLALKAKGRPVRSSKNTLEETVVATYLDNLKETGICDYDVLLHEFRDMLTEDSVAHLNAQNVIRHKFCHLFVDEVQDSASIDWDIYLAAPIRWKFFVGDPDQAIYSFRGGEVHETIKFSRLPGVTLITLEDNFRSHDAVCMIAQNLIEHTAGRLDKATISRKGAGGLVGVIPAAQNEGMEIGQVARRLKDMIEKEPDKMVAVLTRTNAVAAEFRKTLPQCGVAIVEQEHADLPHDWKIARSFIELLSNPENDALAFFYVVALNEYAGKTPKVAREQAHAARRAAQAAGKTINEATLHLGRITKPEIAIQALNTKPITREATRIVYEKYRELPSGATCLDLALALSEVRDYTKEGDGTGVHVLTIHAAKGREFDTVVLVGFEDEACPGRAANIADPEKQALAIEEERRLAYVAITRAKSNFVISYALTRATKWGEIVKRTPSRFIAEMQGGAQ